MAMAFQSDKNLQGEEAMEAVVVYKVILNETFLSLCKKKKNFTWEAASWFDMWKSVRKSRDNSRWCGF